jgi:hypothetical protein
MLAAFVESIPVDGGRRCLSPWHVELANLRAAGVSSVTMRATRELSITINALHQRQFDAKLIAPGTSTNYDDFGSDAELSHQSWFLLTPGNIIYDRSKP